MNPNEELGPSKISLRPALLYPPADAVMEKGKATKATFSKRDKMEKGKGAFVPMV